MFAEVVSNASQRAAQEKVIGHLRKTETNWLSKRRNKISWNVDLNHTQLIILLLLSCFWFTLVGSQIFIPKAELSRVSNSLLLSTDYLHLDSVLIFNPLPQKMSSLKWHFLWWFFFPSVLWTILSEWLLFVQSASEERDEWANPGCFLLFSLLGGWLKKTHQHSCTAAGRFKNERRMSSGCNGKFCLTWQSFHPPSHAC